MLHIVTPLYHYDLLEKIYRTIPVETDITWHISVSTSREKVQFNFIYTDPRIKLYELDCLDSDTTTKRNEIFDCIRDGYFYLLDDDTIFLASIYHIYKRAAALNFKGLLIGNQINYWYPGNIRYAAYPTNDPDTTDIDSGMVLSYYSVLRNVKWEWRKDKRDNLFWIKCSNYFGPDNIKIINHTISIYNSLGLIKIDKKILFIRIRYNITSKTGARVYYTTRSILRSLRHHLTTRSNSDRLPVNRIK